MGSRISRLPACLLIFEGNHGTVVGVNNELLDFVGLEHLGKGLNALVILVAFLHHQHVHIGLGSGGGAGFVGDGIMGNGEARFQRVVAVKHHEGHLILDPGNFNAEKGTHLVSVAGIHYEPFGIYPGTKASLSDIADGDVIAVPNDTTNEARALLLLQDNGIIKLKDDAGLTATIKDIVDNPHNVKIQELEAAQVTIIMFQVQQTAYERTPPYGYAREIHIRQQLYTAWEFFSNIAFRSFLWLAQIR